MDITGNKIHFTVPPTPHLTGNPFETSVFKPKMGNYDTLMKVYIYGQRIPKHLFAHVCTLLSPINT